MKIDDLIVDVAKQNQLKRDVLETLKKHTHDPEQSARVAFVLLEIGIDAFRRGGLGPFLVQSLFSMIAHGATTERALKALMLIQEEDDLKDQIDPSRKERREAEERELDAALDERPKKRIVH